MASLTTEFTIKKPIALVLCLTLIVFFNSIFNGYSLDDELYALSPTLNEPSFGKFAEIFATATFHDKGPNGYEYRPLSLSSFLLEYLIFGKHVEISHVINLLLYLIILFQIYFVLLKLKIDSKLILISLLLFAIHPIHTEIICNLKCRDELLMIVFALFSFHFSMEYFLKNKVLSLLYAFIFILASLLSKPTGSIFLFTIPISILYCLNFNIKKVLPILVSFAVAFLVFKIMRGTAIDSVARKLYFHENPFISTNSFVLNISTAFHVAFRYLKLLIIPAPLAFYYGYKYVDIAYFSEPATLLSIAIHIALVVLLIKNFKKNKSLSFGILFYLLNIIAISAFVKKVPGLMGERFVFSASLGYCIILAFGLQKFGTYFNKFSKYNILLIAILIAFGFMSFKRNKVWKNKETLYSNDIKTLEKSAKANLLYAALISEQAVREQNEAKLDKAIFHVKKTTELVPNYSLAWENLGVLYFFKSDLFNALSCENMALLKDSTNAKAYFDIGMIFEATKYYSAAEKYYLRSLRHDSKFILCYLKLIHIYKMQGKPKKAYEIGESGVVYEKKSDQIYSQLIEIALQNKDTLRAITYMEKVVLINSPKWSETLRHYQSYKK